MHPVDVVDAVDAADRAQQVPEVLGLGHLEGEPADGDAVALVLTVADRMLTRSSDSTRVMSESRPCRSSASTWIDTTKVEPADGAHSTSTSALGLLVQRRGVGAAWCGGRTRRRRA